MKKKALVVDNHPVVLKLMKSLLEKENFHVVTADDGLAGLDILKTYVPDVVFVDLVMPNIDGRKMCRVMSLKPELKDTFIVLLTATAVEESLDLADIGAHACIAKGPFQKQSQYIRKVLKQLGKKRRPDFSKNVIGMDDLYPREVTKELLSIKRHYEVILESMSEGILEITREAKIVFANPKAISILDITEEELLASAFADLFCNNAKNKVQEIINHVFAYPQSEFDTSPIAFKGKQLSIHMVPIGYGEENAIVVLNDVTDQMRIEAQLRQVEKVEAIGTLAAGIAHDFNNLLMGIQGNTSLMLMGTDAASPYYERLKSIERQVQSGSSLTAQLLGYARKGKYEVKPVSLNTLVKEVSETFGRTRKDINISHDFIRDIYAIEVDVDQIEQVLLNLYINAADAMPGGGDIRIKTENVTHEDMNGRLYNPKPGKYVLLIIEDTGMGIDEDTKERIFDPFFTTKKMGRGSGLGLASVYGIIKGHGGFIDVSSEKQKGTIFHIYLPALDKIYREELSQPKKEEIKRGKETILLVDDETVIREVSKEIIMTLGYNVLTVCGGKEAVELYRQIGDEIDLVLLDMIMPNMSGSQSYSRLKELDSNVKVLLSSGYSIDGEATKILSRGCNGFIQKPFNIAELSRAIRQILDS